MDNLSKNHQIFLEALQEFEASYSPLDSNICGEMDNAIELGLHIENIASLAFTFQLSLLTKLTEVQASNAWAWYHFSTFIRYKTVDKLKAFKAAQKAVEILKSDNDFIGAISRNFITLAFENKRYGEMNAELNYLLEHKAPAARILEGVMEDIDRLSMHDAIDDSTLHKLSKA